MAPTEAAILSNFLLPPAPLPTIISLQRFADLFPRAQRGNPQIQHLYRELQHQRALDTDHVKQNITTESKRGQRQMREIAKARRKSEQEDLATDQSREVALENEAFGHFSNQSMTAAHTLRSILPEMEKACSEIEAKIAGIEAGAEEVLSNLSTAVGDLSDLRYGRFNKPGAADAVGQEVLDGLRSLEQACDGVSAGQ
ncbi:MAG: hypothetical protein M1812_005007 [Candelaria pacifica]|nr:MAG: hypothetical protein M1812_005007 [Candelaria pacifica]